MICVVASKPLGWPYAVPAGFRSTLEGVCLGQRPSKIVIEPVEGGEFSRVLALFPVPLFKRRLVASLFVGLWIHRSRTQQQSRETQTDTGRKTSSPTFVLSPLKRQWNLVTESHRRPACRRTAAHKAIANGTNFYTWASKESVFGQKAWTARQTYTVFGGWPHEQSESATEHRPGLEQS